MTFTLASFIHAHVTHSLLPAILAFTLNVSNFFDTSAHNRLSVSCVTPRPVLIITLPYVPHSCRDILLPQARVLCSHGAGVEHDMMLTFVAYCSYQEGQSSTYIYVYTSSLR